MRGPIDFIVVHFEGHNFNGDILKALEEAVDNGTIAVLSASLIYKDDRGEIMGMEATSSGDRVMSMVGEANHNLIAPEDIDEVADLLPNDSAAGLLIIEHLWAKDLKKALIKANGTLLAEGRIHPEAYAEITQEVEV